MSEGCYRQLSQDAEAVREQILIAPHHPDRLRRPPPRPGAIEDDHFRHALLWNVFRSQISIKEDSRELGFWLGGQMTGTLRGGCVIRSDDRATLRDFTECRPHWSIPRACFVSFIFSITLRPSCSGARRQHLRWTQRTRLRAPSSDDRRIPCDVRRPGFGNQVRLVVASFPRIDDA
jgi:hypothetical protein